MFGGLGPTRTAAAVVLIGGLAAMTAWVWTGPARPAPAPVVTAEPTHGPSPSAPPTEAPTTEPLPTEDARLAELRLTDRFLEFAEHPRALEAPNVRYAFLAFAPKVEGEIAFEWSNKIELWNNIAPAIRDEALSLGQPPTRPMWNTDVVVPASVEMTWNTATTEGRGQVAQFNVQVEDASTGEPFERVWVFLIGTAAGAGAVASAMPPFDVHEADTSTFQASRHQIEERIWEWVIQHPRVDEGSR